MGQQHLDEVDFEEPQVTVEGCGAWLSQHHCVGGFVKGKDLPSDVFRLGCH